MNYSSNQRIYILIDYNATMKKYLGVFFFLLCLSFFLKSNFLVSSYKVQFLPIKTVPSFSSKTDCSPSSYTQPKKIFEAWTTAEYKNEVAQTKKMIPCTSNLAEIWVLNRRHVRALNRLGFYDKAIHLLDSLLQQSPPDSIKASLFRFYGYATDLKGEKFQANLYNLKSVKLASSVKSPSERINIYIAAALTASLTHNSTLADSLYSQANKVNSQDAFTQAKLFAYQTDFYETLIDQPTTDRSEVISKLRVTAKKLQDYHSTLKDISISLYTDALIFIGVSYHHQKRSDLAIPYFQKAYSISKSAGLVENQILSQHRLGQSYFLLGNFSLALSFFNQGLAISSSLKTDSYIQRLQFWKGRTLEQLNQLPEAENAFRIAMTIADNEQQQGGILRDAATLFSEQQFFYRNLVRVLLKQKKHTEAFTILEINRARYLQQLRLFSHTLHQASDSIKKKVSLDEQKIVALSADPNAFRLSNLLDIAILSHEKNSYWSHIKPPSPSIRYDTSFVSVLQQHLKQSKKTLVSYFLDEEYDSFTGFIQHNTWAFVLTPATLNAHQLSDSPSTLQNKLEQVNSFFTQSHNPSLPRASTNFNLFALHELYNVLLKPLSPAIHSFSNLLIIPEKSLLSVPFSALVVSRPAKIYSFSSADFLVKHFALSYEHSAALLLEPSENQNFPVDILALGRSQFADIQSPPLSPLYGVERELKYLNLDFPNGIFLSNHLASKDALNANVNQARILHLASHTYINYQNPLYSFFYLGGKDRLFIYELYASILKNDLVVLSGCNTAQGQLLHGEGLEGLQYAFRSSGVTSVVSTLWSADDALYASLMQHFYHYLKLGFPQDTALQKAQLSLLNTKDISPFSWASPVLYGKTSPIHFNGAPLFSFLHVLAFFLLLIPFCLLLLWFFFKRKSLLA
jgi:CHAT domain-containing protein